MDWPTYALARQYLSEEFVGSRVRELRRIEDAEAKETSKRIREGR